MTSEICLDCDGEGFSDYADGEDSVRRACETCNPHGDEFDEDREFEAQMERLAELEDFKSDRD